MSKTQPTVLETGIFPSPATIEDGPYELRQLPTGELVVLCVESGTEHGTEVLARSLYADVESQRRAFIREMAAWFYTNGPKDDVRAQHAIVEVQRALGSEYDEDLLQADREWLQTHDLSLRVPILYKGLPEQARRELVEFAGRVATAGDGVSQSDAQFIEILGAGLGFDSAKVADIVVAAMRASSAVA